MIDKLPDNLDRASIKGSNCNFFASLNVFLGACLYLYLAHPQYYRVRVRIVGLSVTRNLTYHLNWIEFTMELWKEDALTSSLLDYCFQHGNLVSKVILLTEQTSHAAAIIFPGTNW